MNKTVDIKELTGKFNDFRQKNLGKTFTSGELYDAFYAMGFNKNVSQMLTRFLNFEKMGTAKLYSFTKESIHVSKIEAIYKSLRRGAKKYKEKVSATKKVEKFVEKSEEDVIKQAKKLGLRIQRPKGFDIKKFKEDYPDLYERYLIYETV